MASELELLNSATNHSVRMMGAISNALDKNLQVRQKAIDSEIGLEMQLRQAEEQRRMNDASLERYRFMDQMAAQKFEMEKELLPLRKQTELLRMQSEKERLKSYQQTRARQDFDEMVQPHNDRFGMWWMNSQNPAAANEYLQIKAKYAADIANGKPFDSNQFALDTNNIIEKYPVDDKEKPLTKWSYEGQIMADRISPSLGKAYQIKNPVIERNANALAVQYITDPKVTDISTYGEMYSPEYFALAAASREVYQSNVRQIDGLRDQWNDVVERISKSQQLGDDETVGVLLERKNQIESDIAKRESQNSSISIKAATGQLDRDDVKDPVMEEKKRELPKLSSVKTKVEESKDRGSLGYTSYGAEFKKTLQSIAGFTGYANPKPSDDGSFNHGDLLKGIDLSWASGVKIDKLESKRKNEIKDVILENLEDAKKNGFDDTDIISEQRVNSILESINKPTEIHLSKAAVDEIFRGRAAFSGTDTGVRVKSAFGQQSSDKDDSKDFSLIVGPKMGDAWSFIAYQTANNMSSYDDFIKLVSRIKNKNIREAVKNEVYASILTAGITNALEK